MFAFSLTKSFKCLPTGNNCISGILINGCIAHYNTKVNNTFFNRKHELVKFTNAFSTPKPRLHVILGPPSTGKTALVHKIINKKINGKSQFINPLFINCRKGQVDTPDRIYDSIYSQFSPFFDKQKDLLKKVVGGQFSIRNVEYTLGKSRKTTSNDVTRLFDKISAHLPP
jgi:Cdc6-like AAA superfamily ATPase